MPKGKANASEAAGAVLEWADRTLQPPQIVAIIDHDNAPSMRVAERVGLGVREEAAYKGEKLLLFRRLRQPY